MNPKQFLLLTFVAVLAARSAEAGAPQYPFQDWTLPISDRVNDLLSRLRYAMRIRFALCASNALVFACSLDEKVQQTWSIAPGIDRFNITAYNWRSNCVHGEHHLPLVCRVGFARAQLLLAAGWAASGGNWLPNETWTNFPTPMGLGAAWDRKLMRSAGIVTRWVLDATFLRLAADCVLSAVCCLRSHSDEGRALHNLGGRCCACCLSCWQLLTFTWRVQGCSSTLA